jgi:branched-chain amino acid transport system substrate-binding protein
MAGRRVELIAEDYETRPDLALTKARKLVERDRVHAVVGVILASAALALKDYVTTQKVPLIISGFAVSEALTMDRPSPYLFRITYSAAMVPSAMAKWAYQNLGARTAAVIGTDSVGQVEVMMAFARAFEEAGGKVLQEIYTPLGTMDFGPYISKLRRDADVYGLQVTGADAVRFVKQLDEYGLRGKIKLVDLAVSFTDISILPAVGPAALGAYNVQPYFFTLDNPTNRRFAQAFRAKYGRDPGAPAEATYAAMSAIDQAVKATKGNIEDTAAFPEALRKVVVDAPRGRIRFDRFQNSITDVHIAKIEKIGDRMVPVVVAAFPGMDQFLGMDPNEYLKRPRLILLKGTFNKP